MGQVICSGTELRERGKGTRFLVEIDGRTLAAFAIRYQGTVYAFVNRCAHRGGELDWSEGDFFDGQGEFLICATHGARYLPDTGACVGGPCIGQGLTAIAVREQDGKVIMSAVNARLVGAKTQLTEAGHRR